MSERYENERTGLDVVSPLWTRDFTIITLGSVAGTTRCVVDALREQGKKVGLLKIRCMRPFPSKEVAEIVKNAKFMGVLEKDISFGFEGVVYTD